MQSLWQRTRISVNTDGVELSVRDLERGKSRVGALRVIFSWLALLSPTRPFLEVEVSDASLDAADASLDNKPPAPSAPAPRAEWLERLSPPPSRRRFAWAAAVAASDCRLTLRRCRLAAAGVGSLAVEHATADLSLRRARARAAAAGALLARATFPPPARRRWRPRGRRRARRRPRAGRLRRPRARCASAEVATAASAYAAGGGGEDDAVAKELDCRRCGVLAGDDDAERSVLGDVDEELPPALARGWARPAARSSPRKHRRRPSDDAVRCAAGLRLGVGGVALVVERGSRAKAKYVDGKFGGAFAFSRRRRSGPRAAAAGAPCVALRPAGDPAALVASYEPGKLLGARWALSKRAGAAAADFARAARAFRPAPAAPAPALALRCSAARVAAAFHRGATSAGARARRTSIDDAAAGGAYRGGARARRCARPGATAPARATSSSRRASPSPGAGRAPPCDAAARDAAHVSAAWSFVADCRAGAATTLSLADSALVWDGGHWWPLRDWFGFDHERRTEDGAFDAPAARAAEHGDHAPFGLGSRARAPGAGRRRRARAGRPGRRRLRLRLRRAAPPGPLARVIVDAALGDAGDVLAGGGGLAVAGLESAELWTSPDETRRYLHVKSSGAVAACATGGARPRLWRRAARVKRQALGWDDAPPAGAPPSKLEAFEVTLDGIAARAGGREAAVAGARFARRRSASAWRRRSTSPTSRSARRRPTGAPGVRRAGLAGVRAEHAASRVAVALARVDVDAPARARGARSKATAALALALDDVALARRASGAPRRPPSAARVDCGGPRLRRPSARRATATSPAPSTSRRCARRRARRFAALSARRGGRGGGGGGVSRAGRATATVLLRGLDVAVDGVGALRLGPAGLTYARRAGDGASAVASSPAVDAGGGAALDLEPLGGAGAAPCGVVISGTVGDGARWAAARPSSARRRPRAVGVPARRLRRAARRAPALRRRPPVGRALARRAGAAAGARARGRPRRVAARFARVARARLGGLEVDVDARIAYRAGGGRSWTCDADASRVAVAFDGVSLLPALRARASSAARCRAGKHAVGGTAASLAQITGNFSKAASHLALDDEYRVRQQRKEDRRLGADAGRGGGGAASQRRSSTAWRTASTAPSAASHADARAAAALRAAAAAGEAYEPPDLGAFRARAPLDENGTELVVARGGLAVFGPGAPRPHLFAPPDALLGCKLDAADPGSALLLLRPAPGDDEPARYRVRFDGDAAGAALAAHGAREEPRESEDLGTEDDSSKTRSYYKYAYDYGYGGYGNPEAAAPKKKKKKKKSGGGGSGGDAALAAYGYAADASADAT
ncbi:hypothetical protein SO694_00026052 [Aureococcus anophagefferens]|uniref:Uncharacterized protein n=1 Tax=Aureococcus anophagefferens TaxID=44056 RepID=A0ABR1FUG3_AURAN